MAANADYEDGFGVGRGYLAIASYPQQTFLAIPFEGPCTLAECPTYGEFQSFLCGLLP